MSFSKRVAALILAVMMAAFVSPAVNVSASSDSGSQDAASTDYDANTNEDQANEDLAGDGRNDDAENTDVISDEKPAEESTGNNESGSVTRPVHRKTITVKGVDRDQNVYKKRKVKDSVRVTGAYGKTLELQKMTKARRWKTVRSYAVTKAKNAKITVTFPAGKQTYAYYRLRIAGDSRVKTYNSGTIKIVRRNLKSLNLNARSAVIYCMDDGEVIYGKNMNKRLPMASTTKVMTAVVVAENINLKKKKIRISRRAARTPYRNLYMRKGDRYYAKDLFKAMLVSSSNDSARALAENTAGSSRRFVKKMNAKAKKIGLTRTHYTDEVGFGSSTHKQSAKDLARLMTYAYHSKAIRKSIGMKRCSFHNVKHTRWHRVCSSSYPMYHFSRNYLGGKTGTTSAARCCFCAVYKYRGKTYVAVNLGSRNNFYRWRDSKRLYKYIRKYARSGYKGSVDASEPEEELFPETGCDPDDVFDDAADYSGDVPGDNQSSGSYNDDLYDDGSDGEIISLTE